MKRFSIGSKYEFCPNGNYWQDISGIFSKKFYLFCDCKKCQGVVYELKPVNITKKINKDVINRIRNENKLEEIKDKITEKNMYEVLKLIKKIS